MRERTPPETHPPCRERLPRLQSPAWMRTYDPQQVAALSEPERLARLKPFTEEPFDPISLERAGFLSEVGLQAEDELWLRAGACLWSWLSTPLIPRAFSEEALSHNQLPEVYLAEARGFVEEALWIAAERLYLRCERILNHPRATFAAHSLTLKLAEFEALRTRWKREMPVQDSLLHAGLMLQLRGLGLAAPELARRMEQQRFRRVFWFLVFKRPVLSELRHNEVEITVALTSPLHPETRYSVSAGFAREFTENSELGPELWARQWAQYFDQASTVSQSEFRALLDHFEEKERYKWLNLVAVGGGAKARRAVAAVALAAVQKLENADDVASLERLWGLIPAFSEQYELQQVLKKRFGL